MTNRAISKLLEIANSTDPFTDFLISAGDQVMIRNASGWFPIDVEGFSTQDVESLIESIDSGWKDSLFSGRISRTHQTDDWRLRISAYMAFSGTRPMLSIRRTPRYPMRLSDIGLPAPVRLMVENPRGLVLVSGATGAGKTTTTAALVQQINESRRAHVVTIEDPIEYMFVPKMSIFSQREVGVDTPSFFEGVRGALRQRPDVIVIGEIRDRETAETALLAGESGHLVLATLHANSAYGAVQKMLSFFPGESEVRLASLASCLVGVISQVMLPHVDQINGVVATELLFNHKQQFSSLLGSQGNVNEAIERKEDGISKSLSSSLLELVKANVVTAPDALRSVVGQGLIYDKLKASLGA